MKLSHKRAEAIARLLREEGFSDEEARRAVMATAAGGDSVEDPIAEARREALAFRSQKPHVVAEEVKTYPCRECQGTGWVGVTRGWTVGGARIEPGQVAQPAVAQCGVCHGVKRVLEYNPEPERVKLADFLLRHPDSPLADGRLPRAESASPAEPSAPSSASASEEEPGEGRLLLP